MTADNSNRKPACENNHISRPLDIKKERKEEHNWGDNFDCACAIASVLLMSTVRNKYYFAVRNGIIGRTTCLCTYVLLLFLNRLVFIYLFIFILTLQVSRSLKAPISWNGSSPTCEYDDGIACRIAFSPSIHLLASNITTSQSDLEKSQ